MRLKEINKDKTPELFYSTRVDNVWVETEQIPVKDGIRLRRKAKDGWQDVWYDAEGTFHLYFLPEIEEVKIFTDIDTLEDVQVITLIPGKEELITTAYVTPEYLDWEKDQWLPYDFKEIKKSITYVDNQILIYITDGVSTFVTKQDWGIGNGKQTFDIQTTAKLKLRVRWIVKPLNEEKLVLNYDDFKLDTVSDVRVELVDVTREVVFAPDGIDDSIEIDPYLELDETSSTITITTDDDVLVFTISTYDAVLIEGNSGRVIIFETDMVSSIYRDVMFQYGDGTSSVSGLTYSAQNISTDFNWFPLTSDAYDDRTARTAQYQNESDLTFTTGAAVTSGTGHTSIGTDGFASDGAYHVDPADDLVKLELGQIEHKPVVVLHDFPYQTGATNYTLEQFKLEDNAVSSTVVATTGNNGNWEAVSDGGDRNTNNDDYNDAVNGKGLDTGNGTAYLDLATTNYDNDFFKTGSVLFKTIPQFINTDGADQTLFHCYVDANNYLHLFYDAGTNQFHYTVVWGSTSTTLTSTAYSNDAALQIIQNIRINHDSVGNKISLEINGRVEDADTNTGTPSASNPTKATVGAEQDRSTPGDYILLNIQSFNSPINCFGAFFTGNTAAQLSAGMYHEDILEHWSAESNVTDTLKGETITASGSPSYVTGVNSNALQITGASDYVSFPFAHSMSKGSFSCWIKITAGTPDAYAAIWTMTTDYLTLFSLSRYNGGDDMTFFIDGTPVPCAGLWVAIANGGWNHLVLTWDSTTDIAIGIVNGIQIFERTATAFTAPDLTGENLNIGNRIVTGWELGGIIDEIYFTNNPNTPQIPTANGVPCDAPIRRDN